MLHGRSRQAPGILTLAALAIGTLLAAMPEPAHAEGPLAQARVAKHSITLPNLPVNALATTSLAIQSPVPNKAYSGDIPIIVRSSKPATMTVLVDGKPASQLTLNPQTGAWTGAVDTKRLPDGPHTITVVASSGEVAAMGNIIVANTPPARSFTKLYGVNLAGAEFGDDKLPGRIFQDYIYPNDREPMSYFNKRGQKLLRLPFRWERIQRAAFQPLHQEDLAEIRKFMDTAAAEGQLVILDVHNYARYHGAPMRVADAPKLGDLWKRLATEFREHPALFGYELMNEPHDLPEGSSGWARIAQQVVNDIRTVDTKNFVLVPGYDWQGAMSWPEENRELDVKDSANKLIYAAHIYFDDDFTGTYDRSYDQSKTYPAIGSDRVRPFLDWLKAKNAKGMITEFGVPWWDPRYTDVLRRFMTTLDQDPSIVGATCWAAGPWWGDYELTIEPKNGADRQQINVLAEFKSR
jgi:endoglucanase